MIIDRVVECVRNEGVDRVTHITIEVGNAAGVEPDALRFCFDIVARDTMVQGAELAVERIPLQARCRDCGVAGSGECRRARRARDQTLGKRSTHREVPRSLVRTSQGFSEGALIQVKSSR